ncbi:MAG: hypothetical protein WDN24_02315 [Sphingomonas sp.]
MVGRTGSRLREGKFANGRYHCLQAKRHKSFGAAKLRDAVDLFLAGIRFEAPDGDQLTDRLCDQPRLIDDFFGRAWVAALLGEEVAATLHATNFWSAASYPHRELAAALLLKYWPGDDTLVAGALAAQSNRNNSPWEYDVATAYLMESPVERDDVRRTAANTYWLEPRNRLISMYKLPNYLAYAADPDVGEMLVGMLGETKNMDRYWAVTALLSGWGREHPLVGPAFDKLVQADDADLLDLASLLPEILPDRKEARDRLIRMARQPEMRRDLLAIGLEACGCDGTDDAAVEALLDRGGPPAPLYDPAYPLFRAFGTHPKVRALALQRAGEADGPGAAITEAYPDDPELAPALFGMVVPLPVELRTQIVEAASAGAPGTALEAVLAEAMAESDPELRARMVIAHGRALPPEEHDAFRDTLLDAATAVGTDYESARAAALAGLATIGAPRCAGGAQGARRTDRPRVRRHDGRNRRGRARGVREVRGIRGGIRGRAGRPAQLARPQGSICGGPVRSPLRLEHRAHDLSCACSARRDAQDRQGVACACRRAAAQRAAARALLRGFRLQGPRQ